MTALILSLLAIANDARLPAAAGAGEVFVCDFEEATDRDYDGWPDSWVRVHSRGLPEFLRVGIVPEPGPGSPANSCLQFELDGGGAVASCAPVAISPNFSFVLS